MVICPLNQISKRFKMSQKGLLVQIFQVVSKLVVELGDLDFTKIGQAAEG